MTLPINTQPTNSALFPGQAQAPTMPAGQPTAVQVPTMPPDTMSVAPQAVPQVPLYPQSSGQGLGGMLESLFSLLGRLVSGLTGFVKRLFAANPGAPSGAVAQTPAFPAPAQPAPLPQPPVGTLPAPVVTTPAPVVTPPAPTPVTPTPVVATPPATTAPAPVVATPTPVVTPPTQVVVPPTTEGQPPVVTVPVNGTAPTAPAPTPATPAPATPAPGTQYQATTPLTAEELAMCQQQGILATPENFKAFITEAQALEGANALGPGSTQTESISELQQLLAGWGYAVAATGQFDQATIDAVTKFKMDNGIAATYKMADGTPGVHPFVDEATKAAMIKKLESGTPVVTPPTQYQGPTPVTPTPVVTPPATEGQPPVVTVPVNTATTPAPTTPVTPAPVTPAPVTPAPGTQYQAAPLAGEELAIAQQQGLLATRENFDTFMKEAQALEAVNALGPGSTQTESISELQQLLAGWGYAVAATGQFDQATVDAVTKFKRDSGVAATYKMADGTPGVHPFIDDATKAAMIKRLETAAPVVAPPTQYQAPTPVTPAPVVTPPTTGQPQVVTVPVTGTPAAPVATPAPVVPPTTNGQPPVVTVSVNGAPVTAPAAPAAPVTVPGSQYQAVGLSAEEQAIAQQQGIQASRENFDAFMREAQAIEAERAIGPGSTERDAITELQGLMAGWGYAVAATGAFDAATEAALVKFKQDNGLAASYRLADGSPAYHPFIDAATKAKMVQKLGG
jgi:N-acetyl-anhydromuramyl-L-alanine amidase AmpD